MAASEAWAAAVGVSVVALALVVYYLVSEWFVHKERMAKIQQGIDPDSKTKKPESK